MERENINHIYKNYLGDISKLLDYLVIDDERYVIINGKELFADENGSLYTWERGGNGELFKSYKAFNLKILFKIIDIIKETNQWDKIISGK